MANSTLRRKFGKFAALDGTMQWLVVRAAGWLALARLRLALSSFKALAAKRLAENVGAEPEADQQLLEQVSTAIAIAANNVPWRSDCFPQALAASMLLQRQGIRSTIHFGVAREDDDQLQGHAWLMSGEFVVTGGSELHRFTELLAD